MKTTELARRINTSNANMHHIFNRESIDTDLLHQIGAALDYDFFKLYTNFENIVSEPSESYHTNKMSISIMLNNIPISQSSRILEQIKKLIK